MEIVTDRGKGLDGKMREKAAKHERIHEPEILDGIAGIMTERDVLTDDAQRRHDKLKNASPDASETPRRKGGGRG